MTAQGLPAWAPKALALQLVLTFFVPAVSLGSRSVFPSDLWLWIWLIIALYGDWRQGWRFFRPLFGFFVTSALVLGVVYAHGYFRPSLAATLEPYFKLSEPDTFNPVRELILYLRFLSWLWAGGVVWAWFSSVGLSAKRALSLMSRVLSACLLGVLAMMVAAKVSPDLKALFGQLYGYDPENANWYFRAHGPFRSPVEAGTAMVFGGLLLFSRFGPKTHFFGDGVVGAFAAVWLTHTATPLVALFVVAVIVAIARLPGRLRWITPLALIAASGLALAVAYPRYDKVRLKLTDFLFRFGPWQTYWDAALERVDLLLFGYGWTPYHTDSAYVWLLNRGGLLLLAAFVWLVARALRRYWSVWGWPERSIVLFVLVAGFAQDVFIYRPVVALLITVGIPALAVRSKLP